MKTFDFEQGSLDWRQARLGIPTASATDRLLTPKTLKPSTQQDKYLCELMVEWALGLEADAASGWMDRGTAMEEDAAGWYEFEYGVDLAKVGFWTTDDGRFGGSPDRLVGDDGILEIKCPSAVVHMGYLMEPQKLVDAYRLQNQANLWISGRKWCDIVSYNPELPKVIRRVELEPEFVEAFEPVLNTFCSSLDAWKSDYVKNYGPPVPRTLEYIGEVLASLPSDGLPF